MHMSFLYCNFASQKKNTMPATKQKLIRHYALDRCLRNQTRRYYIEDLLAECNKALEAVDCLPISLRTIKNGINEFETLYNTVIAHLPDSHGRIYYRYEDPQFSLQKSLLSDEEVAKLKDALLMLSRFKGLPQFEWMTELVTKIEAKLHLDAHTESVIGFEANEYLQGLEHLESLFDYICNKQTIDVTYQPYDKPGFLCTLHPYYIKQHNSRWFLLAMNNQTQKMMLMALDRIQEIHLSNIAYVPVEIDFAEYFDDVIGVTIPQDTEPQHISLRFSAHRLPYVLSKPMHHSQKIKDKSQGIIEITVIPNRELEAQLLWFGNDVEVLQPETLRLQIATKIAKMHDLYS